MTTLTRVQLFVDGNCGEAEMERLRAELAQSKKFEDASESGLRIEVAAREQAEAKLAKVVEILERGVAYRASSTWRDRVMDALAAAKEKP